MAIVILVNFIVLIWILVAAIYFSTRRWYVRRQAKRAIKLKVAAQIKAQEQESSSESSSSVDSDEDEEKFQRKLEKYSDKRFRLGYLNFLKEILNYKETSWILEQGKIDPIVNDFMDCYRLEEMGYRFDERARNLGAIREVAEEDEDDKSIGEIAEEQHKRMRRPMISDKLINQERIGAGSLINKEDEHEITEFSFRAIVQDI